ncbi:sugar ABC transporter substrate-binding protein [Pseudomonas frederiksbergensis]|uniref:Sugar ABC transporter substrate-binding protein n=1 Tax=Pseudomonas frederiksbergensis TaxID=104087 RepID=A0A423HJE8_9PSED|nr:sugar ABC transporter substrate-binding protein [Pseudomonas frederiksbergensis]RON13247.1 sugar ABC transporter substrate-binding protein [Pseudomonas frederiksbergensis]RON14137.1 sugar ABC transporter substrate-binding protein [Pseudomonas frederiksbergensis]
MKAQKGGLLCSVVLAAGLTFQLSPAFAAGEKILINFQTLSIPYFIYMHEQASQEAKVLNVELLVQDAQSSSTKQSSDVENALTQGVDAMVVAPNDVTALAPALNEVLSEKVPLVTVDRRVEGTDTPVPYVTADSVAGGRLMAELVTSNVKNGARVAFIGGTPGSSTAIDRAKGVHDGLKAGGGKFQLVAEQSGEWERAKAMSVAENILTSLSANPPDAIICASGDMALGAAEAVRAMGLKGKVKVIGFDAYPEVLRAIRDGDIAGIVEQSPSKQIRTALQMAVKKVRGEGELETVIVQPFMVTQENLSQAEQYSAIQ